MRNFLVTLAALAGLLLSLGEASAQAVCNPGTGTCVQQVATRLDAGTFVAQGTNNNTINQQSVATVTVPGGLSAYITAIIIDVCGDGTGTAATNVNFTSAGIMGTPSWSYSSTTALSLSTCVHLGDQFSIPLKSVAPGTAVVITSPTALGHTGFNIRVIGYFAP
jgi:hypothetical protein